jgi:hypothetical protein
MLVFKLKPSHAPVKAYYEPSQDSTRAATTTKATFIAREKLLLTDE